MVYMVTLSIKDEMHPESNDFDVVVYNIEDPNMGALFEDKADAERLMALMKDLYPDETYKILELEITAATPSPVL